jgi:hypothetical protein
MAQQRNDQKAINEIKRALIQAIPQGADSILLIRAIIQLLESQKAIAPRAAAIAEAAERR